jgi:hypothetical protein
LFPSTALTRRVFQESIPLILPVKFTSPCRQILIF